MESALDPQMELTSLKVTHVYYNPSDPLSLVSAYVALVPQALMVIYVTLIYSRREIEIVLMFGGQLLCELTNWTLKRLIKEDRPKHIIVDGYGMPSSHSQFMTFFAVYVTLYMIHRTVKMTLMWRLAHCLVVIIAAGVVSMSRVYLRYHTPRQVAIGAGIGACLGVAWYVFVMILRYTGWVEWVLRIKAVEMLWFKDGDIGSLEHDLREEWMEWRQRHQQPLQKVTKKRK